MPRNTGSDAQPCAAACFEKAMSTANSTTDSKKSLEASPSGTSWTAVAKTAPDSSAARLLVDRRALTKGGRLWSLFLL